MCLCVYTWWKEEGEVERRRGRVARKKCDPELIHGVIIREENSREQEVQLQSSSVGVYLAYLKSKVSVAGVQ